MRLPGIDLVEALTGTAELSPFRRVVSFRMAWEGAGRHVAPVLDLWVADESAQELRVHVRFGGVRALRLEGFGGPETRIAGFAIDHVGERQLDEVTWELHDFEDDCIACLATSAEVVEVVRVEHLL